MKNLGTLFLFSLLLLACNRNNNLGLKEGIYAEITTEKGMIVASLAYKKTPITVANFITLAEGTNTFVDEKFSKKRFYDGMLFQRNQYVIQAGDPKGEGSGTGYFFEDEFPVDEQGNFLLTHNSSGVLSMANSGTDTNSSQFFITFNKSPSLDGKHSVFGRIVEGHEIVDSIVSDDKITKIEIIRKGKSANDFDALSVFAKHFKSFSEKKKEEGSNAIKRSEKAQKAKKQMQRYFVNNKRLAKEFPSGLKMLMTKKGTGKKPKPNSEILINFAGFTADGNLFSTTVLKTAEVFNMYDERYDQPNKYHPLMQIYSNKASLITGLKEGLLKMEYGEKAVLFIPSKLAYGEKGDGYVIPPDTDLIIEVEIVDEVFE